MYTDCNGNTVKFKGVRYALAFMVFHDYVNESDIADTFTGFAQKQRNETRDLNSSRRKKIQEGVKVIFKSELKAIEEFLNENKDNYPLWICTNAKSHYTPKMYTLKRTKY